MMKKQRGLSILAAKERGPTLKSAREKMLSRIERGTKCPCCGRFVKIYKRKLHQEMAIFLIKLVAAYLYKKRYYSTRELLPDAVKAATDGAYLVHWDLVERQPGKNLAGAKAGMYRPTEKGIDFVKNVFMVPSHLHMLCGEPVGFSNDLCSINDCLGDDFNYDDLMAL